MSQAVWSECRRRWEQIVKGETLLKLTVLYSSMHTLFTSNTAWLLHYHGITKHCQSWMLQKLNFMWATKPIFISHVLKMCHRPLMHSITCKKKKHFTTKHVSCKPATIQKQLVTLPIQITSKMPAIISPAKKTLIKTPQTEIQIHKCVMHETLIIQQLHKNNIRKCNFQFQHSLSKVIRYHDDIKTNSKTDHLNWTELNGKTGVNCLCVCLSVCLKNKQPHGYARSSWEIGQMCPTWGMRLSTHYFKRQKQFRYFTVLWHLEIQRNSSQPPPDLFNKW